MLVTKEMLENKTGVIRMKSYDKFIDRLENVKNAGGPLCADERMVRLLFGLKITEDFRDFLDESFEDSLGRNLWFTIKMEGIDF